MARLTPKSNRFSVKELNSLTIENDGDKLTDGNGLFGRVRVNKQNTDNCGPTIKISWEYAFKWQKKVEWFYCGLYPNKSITEIRKERDKAKALVTQGYNPRLHAEVQKIENTERQLAALKRDEIRKNESVTIYQLVEHWVSEGVKRKDGNMYIKAMFKNHLLPYLGKIALKDLTEKQLIKTYQILTANSKYKTLIELHKTISSMFKWAEKRSPYRKLLMENNPVILVNIELLIPDDYESKRDRCLTQSEIKALYKVFLNNPISEKMQIAVWLSLACTCRISELTMAEWKHIDFDKKTWFIPKENIKGGAKRNTDHTVYLSNFALHHFRRLKDISGSSNWCFPSNRSHLTGKAVTKAIGDRQLKFMTRNVRLNKRTQNNSLVIGNEKWSPHDCRRTGATLIQELFPMTEQSIFIAKLCLNHKVVDGAAVHYLHHEYRDKMRLAWSVLGDSLANLTYLSEKS